MKLTIVDVFAEALYEGNPLAVIHDAGALDTPSMQAIAREMNFSESTFVTRADDGRARVRIFTPGEELAFAGHPVIGTAWVLRGGRNSFELEVPAGKIGIQFAGGLIWMTPPAAVLGKTLSIEHAADLVGLETADLDEQWSPQLMSCGPAFLLVVLRSLDALRRLAVDMRLQNAMGRGTAVFAVCRSGYSDDADFAARMHFFDGIGIREDPATGSANSAFAAYLKSRGQIGRFVVEQGFEIQRPSRVYLDVGDANAIGGKVQLVVEGRLAARGQLPGSVTV